LNAFAAACAAAHNHVAVINIRSGLSRAPVIGA